MLKCHTIILAFSEIVHMWIECTKKKEFLHFKSIFYVLVSLYLHVLRIDRGEKRKKTEWKMRIWDFYLIFSICCRDSSYRHTKKILPVILRTTLVSREIKKCLYSNLKYHQFQTVIYWIQQLRVRRSFWTNQELQEPPLNTFLLKHLQFYAYKAIY